MVYRALPIYNRPHWIPGTVQPL